MPPLRPHEHWHIDVSYLNISGTFYYLCAVLDGYSRQIIHWEIRETMKEAEVEIILERAKDTKRLHSAIGYINPQDKLLEREKEIFSERDRKLSEARQRRAAKRKIA
mgnify:FL=1